MFVRTPLHGKPTCSSTCPQPSLQPFCPCPLTNPVVKAKWNKSYFHPQPPALGLGWSFSLHPDASPSRSPPAEGPGFKSTYARGQTEPLEISAHTWSLVSQSVKCVGAREWSLRPFQLWKAHWFQNETWPNIQALVWEGHVFEMSFPMPFLKWPLLQHSEHTGFDVEGTLGFAPSVSFCLFCGASSPAPGWKLEQSHAFSSPFR